MRFSHEKLGLEKTHIAKIGEEGLKLRSLRLKELTWIEDLIHDRAPLPCTYDIQSRQKPHFREYTYTEHCFGISLRPQSVEVGCRIMHKATQELPKFSVEIDDFRKKLDEPLDKYTLNSMSKSGIKRVVFLPGSNIMFQAVSKEILSRLMHENDDIFIKLHPFTSDDDVYFLGAEFGYERMLPRRESGLSYLLEADECWTASNSELSSYIVMAKKKLGNITNFFWESCGAHYPLFREFILLDDVEKRKDALESALSCEYSGLLNPLFYEREEVVRRIDAFFTYSLELRKEYKELASPINLQGLPQRKAVQQKKEKKKLVEF